MKKLKTEEFISKAKEVHGDKYDYSKVDYVNAKTEIEIICKIHGSFYQTPDNHLHSKGCPFCNKNDKLTTEEFISKAREIHGDKYDYSKVEYVSYHTKVCIICPIHGEFWQEPANHLCGRGCRKCSRNSYNYTTEEWINLAKEIRGNFYDYSKVSYKNSTSKVCIICPIHGEFWQKPNNHLQGQGCPHCNESKLEKYVYSVLKENKIDVERQKKFDWLGRQTLDFYLPGYGVAIECQGIQHYKPTDFGGKGNKYANKEFLDRIKRDKTKLDKVENHNIKMVYVNENNKNNFLNKII